MYVVIEKDSKQYQVQEGRWIDIDLLEQTPDSSVTFDKVIAVVAGEYSQIGQPYIEGASVIAKVVKHDKADKVSSFKIRRKKGYRRKLGHRQDYTRILVEQVDFPNKEETLSYVKKLEEQLESELQAKEAKLQAAIEKRFEKKQTKVTSKKETKVQHTEPEKIVPTEETMEQPEEITEVATTEVTETTDVVETTHETTEHHEETAETATETTDTTEEKHETTEQG
jgi:large subunit ribosomal protein L21